jgi:hypothetical protein
MRKGGLFLRTDFVVALQTALPSDPIMGPLAAAAAETPASAHASSRLSFVLRDGLLYRRSPRGDRLCVPAGGELRLQVLRELHATPLGGHFGRDKTLSLARRSVWWQGLPADVEAYVQSCLTCQRVKADHLRPAGLLFPPSARPDTPGRLHQPGLPRAPAGTLRSRLPAGAHRPPDGPRVARP